MPQTIVLATSFEYGYLILVVAISVAVFCELHNADLQIQAMGASHPRPLPKLPPLEVPLLTEKLPPLPRGAPPLPRSPKPPRPRGAPRLDPRENPPRAAPLVPLTPPLPKPPERLSFDEPINVSIPTRSKRDGPRYLEAVSAGEGICLTVS